MLYNLSKNNRPENGADNQGTNRSGQMQASAKKTSREHLPRRVRKSPHPFAQGPGYSRRPLISFRPMVRSHDLNKVRKTRDEPRNRGLGRGLLWLALASVAALLVFNNWVMPRYTRVGEAFSMPQVTGMDHETAVDSLQRGGLGAVQWDTVLDFSVTRGTVLAQRPLAYARVKPGRTVYLKVSDNTRYTVLVPDLVGETTDAARIKISRAQLQVGEVLANSVPGPYANIVIRQEPSPSTPALLGDPVTVWYSTGPGNRLVEIPDVVGQLVQWALADLRRAGLHGKIYPPVDTLGFVPTVSSQSHPPGTRVAEGTELTLFWDAESQENQ